MAENKLADLSIDFAVSILKVTDGIKGHYTHKNNPLSVVLKTFCFFKCLL